MASFLNIVRILSPGYAARVARFCPNFSELNNMTIIRRISGIIHINCQEVSPHVQIKIRPAVPARLLDRRFNFDHRLDWFLENPIPNVILLLIDIDEANPHCRAICSDSRNRLVILDAEEHYALPFNLAALDYCCGPGQTVTGLGHAFSVSFSSNS